MIPVLFVLFAGVLVGASVMVVLHRHPVTSALFLVLGFCALAGLYLLLQAQFVALVQVLVYAGAIMVLFLFVLMYLNLKRDQEEGVHHHVRRIVGRGLGILLMAEGVLLFRPDWAVGPMGRATAPIVHAVGNTEMVGRLLYSRYLFPFELTSLVLLVALVGAVVIGKGRQRPPEEEDAG